MQDHPTTLVAEVKETNLKRAITKLHVDLFPEGKPDETVSKEDAAVINPRYSSASFILRQTKDGFQVHKDKPVGL